MNTDCLVGLGCQGVYAMSDEAAGDLRYHVSVVVLIYLQAATNILHISRQATTYGTCPCLLVTIGFVLFDILSKFRCRLFGSESKTEAR